jgi:hypothetical protein
MDAERDVRWLFGANAVINWVVSVRGIVDPVGMAEAFGGAAPNYPFLVRLWSAFVFMFGCMFLEVARDPRGKAALAKYNWIEKTLTALAVTVGWMAGEAPARLMALIVLTNWLWIPAIVWADRRLQSVTGGIAPVGAGPAR